MKKTMRAIALVMACLFVLAAFVSCGKSAESVKKKAEKNGYKCESATAEELKAISEDEDAAVTEKLIITDEATGKSVAIFFFENKKDAKAVAAKYEESSQATRATGLVAERKGKAVAYGNADIIENIW